MSSTSVEDDSTAAMSGTSRSSHCSRANTLGTARARGQAKAGLCRALALRLDRAQKWSSGDRSKVAAALLTWRP